MSNSETWTAEVNKTWEGCVVDGKFPLRQWLGGSAHSAVFLTERQSQKVAIKLVPAGSVDANGQLDRWRTAAQLSHPHLLRVYESGRGEVNGAPVLYAVMELADEDLWQILPHRALTPAEAADLLPPVLDALSYLHARKLVHGRIKPSNLLADGDQVKLSADHIVSSSEINSEPRRRDVFDAPETAAGIVSPAGDMWSLGVTLVVTLTQIVPVSEEASQHDPHARPKIVEPFRGIVRECMHLDPNRRCLVAEVQARLQPAARSVPAEPEPMPAPEPRSRRALVTVLLLAIAVVLGIFIIHSRGKTTPPSTAAEAPPTTASSETSSETSTRSPARQTAPQTDAAPQATPRATPTPSVAPRSKPVPSPRETVSSANATDGEGIVRQVIPAVPRSARNTITGKIRVSVRVNVDSSGKVTDATLTSPGPSKYFANLALNAARGWEFSTAQASGQPTPTAWMLHFRFGRGGTQVSPESIKR